MALTPPLLSLSATVSSWRSVGLSGEFREPLPPGTCYISNDDDGLVGGGSPTPLQNSAIVPTESASLACPRAIHLARGMAGDAASLAAKWAVMGSLAYFVPPPWGWLAAAATMGAVAVFNGVRLLTHVVTENLDRYEAKYDVLMGRIDFSWIEMNRLRRDGAVPLYERSRRYQELLKTIRLALAELEEMSFCDPEHVMARGSVSGILYLFFAAALTKDERASNRYERESLVRSYRRFVHSLPAEMPTLPPESTDEGSYRELPARFRVEVPSEFSDFEEELAAIEEDRAGKEKRRAP